MNVFLIDKDIKIYGISQNPVTKDYIIVLQNKYYRGYDKTYCKKCIEKYTNIERRWCKPCQINYFKKNFINWRSGNEKIDHFIQKMQLNINNPWDMVFEWISCNQFNKINEGANKGDFITAIWKDGPLYYDCKKKKWARKSCRKVSLKYLYNFQNDVDEFLNKV